ncbi:hypothetical protein [Protaetiibacter intestinalis]|uniref:Uncharacterized protein n=1 Tax=Protaetiibacter intestinalis TaxID=2419774 RepID=A0A387B0R5_9MICO|nr:hypothetical protein [Protaetiibacter intestinalis]AYF97082.1 hypothetical protein D7I47_01665 [Protaetiibacter intestinalis]
MTTTTTPSPRGIVAAASVTATAALLCACTPVTTGRGAEEPRPASEAPAADALDEAGACLVDHSPWSLDIGRLLDDHAAFLGSTAPEATPSSWSAEGTALMTFTEGARIWQFVAEDVVFTIQIPTGDGPLTVRSAQVEEQNGEFRVIDGGFVMIDAAASLAHVDDTTTTFADGSVSGPLPVGAPPVFPWSRDIVTGQTSITHQFSCSASELVITTASPYGYHFVPGA